MSATVFSASSVGFVPMNVEYAGEAATATGRPHPLQLLIAQQGAVPDWLSDVLEDAERLSLLPDNWDQRGAARVNAFDVVDAFVFLGRVMSPTTRPPRLAPLTSGGVELLWRGDNVEVEAIFDRNRDEQTLLVEAGENDWESPIEQADSLFLSVRDRLGEQDPLVS